MGTRSDVDTEEEEEEKKKKEKETKKNGVLLQVQVVGRDRPRQRRGLRRVCCACSSTAVVAAAAASPQRRRRRATIPRSLPILETTSVRYDRSPSPADARRTRCRAARCTCAEGAPARGAAFHPKTRRAHRALRVTGAFDPSFAAAAVDVCVAAEVEDGVDSSRWVLDGTSAGGVPGRAAAHPRYLDERTGRGGGGFGSRRFWCGRPERSDFGTGVAETDE